MVTQEKDSRRGNTRGKQHVHLMTFRAELTRAHPLIWREFSVPSSYSLWDLHCALTDLFGWTDSHLHEFHIPLWVEVKGEKRLCEVPFGIEADDGVGTCLADWRITLEDLLRQQSPAFVAPAVTAEEQAFAFALGFTPEQESLRSLWYKYDFGDAWTVELTLQAVVDAPSAIGQATVIAGERAGPPDDFGGIAAFNDFIAGRLSKEDRRERQQWLKGLYPGWSPADWDAAQVRFSNPKARLDSLLDNVDLPDDLDLPFATRLTNLLERNHAYLKFVIDDISDGIVIWYGLRKGTSAYLLARDAQGRPESWRRLPGVAPLPAATFIVNRFTPDNTKAPVSIIIPLPSSYSCCETREHINHAFLVFHENLDKTAPIADTLIQVGKVITGPIAPAMRAAITRSLNTANTPFQVAASTFLLATFDDTVRTLLGLDDDQVVVAV